MRGAARPVIVGDRYAWDPARGVCVDGTPIADVALVSPKVTAARPTVPADFVLREDPILGAERLVLGALLAGDVTLAEADEAILAPGHRLIVDALRPTGFDAAEIWEQGGPLEICRRAGVPPELTGTVISGQAIGYLASVQERAPGRKVALAAVGRLRAARQEGDQR